MARYSSTRRQITWATAMRDLRQDRSPFTGPNPMFLASLARARVLDARREARAAQERQEDRS